MLRGVFIGTFAFTAADGETPQGVPLDGLQAEASTLTIVAELPGRLT